MQILRRKYDGTFELDEAALANILLAPRVKDKPVAIVSVAGAFRMGKSFLLGFFLRYMRSKDKDNWLGDPDAPLTGFKGRGGCDGDTKGVWVWSEAFLVTTRHNDQIAVLLMDTQGAFDCESTTLESTTIFAFSTLMSSVQVYNLSRNIQENNLQYLEYFTDYAQLAQEGQQGTSAKPFQKLLFLVRDWCYPVDAAYGAKGGKELIQKRLDIPTNMAKELEMLRQHIRSSFAVIDCFLLPHPGEKVSTETEFDGRLSDIAATFTEHLKDLVPSLLAPDKLLVKEVNGKKISCKQLLEYLKAYIGVFRSGKLPRPMSALKASVEVYNRLAMNEAKEAYRSAMQEHINRDGRWYTPKKLQGLHDEEKQSALKSFLAAPKWGGKLYSKDYLEKLEQDIDESFETFVKRNDRKARVRTTVALSVIATVSIVSTGGFVAVGMIGVTAASGVLAGATIAGAAVRNNVPSRGRWRAFFTFMDKPVNYVWDSVAIVLWRPVVPASELIKPVEEEKQPLLPKEKMC